MRFEGKQMRVSAPKDRFSSRGCNITREMTCFDQQSFMLKDCAERYPFIGRNEPRNRIRGESATAVQILTIPLFCRFTGAIARVMLGAFDKGAGKKASCRSKSTHLTGRPDHPRPAKVGGAGCAAI
jgi:hypothetical protein